MRPLARSMGILSSLAAVLTVCACREATSSRSGDAALVSLTLSDGAALSPGFDPLTLGYSSSVPSSTAQLHVTGTARHSGARLTINGTAASSGVAFGPIALTEGATTTVTIVVTAENGTTTQSYAVAVTREAAGADAALSGLALGAGAALTPSFASLTTSYAASVGYSVSQLTVTATTRDASATLTINGSAATSGAPFGPVALPASFTTTVSIVVTAVDGTTTKTYVVSVTRAGPSTDASLSALSLTSGTLVPAFDSATTSYAAGVPNATSSIRVTATTSESHATLTINGQAATAGVPSGPIALALGANGIPVVVTAQDGTTTRAYTVTVTRAGSNNAALSGLLLSGGATLSPTFAMGTTSYTSSVFYGTTSIYVTATTQQVGATLTVNGNPATSGVAYGPIDLVVGPNTITVHVTAQDGTTSQDYVVSVTRQAAVGDAALSSLWLKFPATIAPSFDSAITSYTARVAYATTTIKVTATPRHGGASLTINGSAATPGVESPAISLSAGAATTITVRVIADDGTTRDYFVEVTRDAPSDDANLVALGLTDVAMSPAFLSNTLSYAASVPATSNSVVVSAYKSHPRATIRIYGNPVASGQPYTAAVYPGSTANVDVRVTAEDGVTIKAYTIAVSRPLWSSNKTLADLSLGGGVTVNPPFDGSTTAYTASVAYSVSDITVTATASDPKQRIVIDGTAVPSAVPSAPVPLAGGTTTIPVYVYAEDESARLYNIAVTRGLAPAEPSLAQLKVAGAQLSPTFDVGTTSYAASVPHSVTSVSVTAWTGHDTDTLTINGSPATSGTAFSGIGLAPGATTTIPAVVTLQDGTASKTYSVAVTRLPPSGDARLSALSVDAGPGLSPAFSPDVSGYSIPVPFTVASVKVKPTVLQPYATVAVNGTPVTSGTASTSIPLLPGAATTLSVVVTAEDQVTTKTYRITVVRGFRPSDPSLVRLGIVGGPPIAPRFHPETRSYAAEVPSTSDSVSVLAEPNDPEATMTVQGVAVANGTASTPIALAAGATTSIAVVVTSKDASTAATYTLEVTRPVNSPPMIASVSPASHPALVRSGSTLAVSVVATDPEGQPLTYAWSASGVGGTFADASQANTVYTAPATYGLAQIRVVVSDGSRTAEKRFMVVVNGASGWFDLARGVTAESAEQVDLVIDPTGAPITMLFAKNAPMGTSDRLAVVDWTGAHLGGHPAQGAIGSISWTNWTQDADLELAPDGTPYVAFADSSQGGALQILQFDGSRWLPVPTPPLQMGAEAVRLAFNSGRLYLFVSAGSFRCFVFEDGRWYQLGSPFQATDVSFIDVDFLGTVPYVFYRTSPRFPASIPMALEYLDGMDWALLGGAAAGESAEEGHVAVTSTGTVYTAWAWQPGGSGTNVNSYGNTWNGTAWGGVTMLVSSTVNEGMDLVLGSNGAPYLLASERLFQLQGSTWTQLTTAFGNVAFFSENAVSLALRQTPTSARIFIVGYSDESNGDRLTIRAYTP